MNKIKNKTITKLFILLLAISLQYLYLLYLSEIKINYKREYYSDFKTSKLPTVVGEYNSLNQIEANKIGVILYGPNIPLEKGSYKFVVFGKTDSNESELLCDVVNTEPNKATVLIKSQHYNGIDEQLCSLVFSLKENVTNIEFRVIQQKLASTTINSYHVEYIKND